MTVKMVKPEAREKGVMSGLLERWVLQGQAVKGTRENLGHQEIRGCLGGGGRTWATR